MENESYGSVIGNPKAPYQTSLAQQCGTAVNFYNESHGSLDNYIAATDGQSIINSDFVSDCSPNVKANLCVSNSPNIFSQVQAAGMSWRNYAEDMPSNCYHGNSGNYAVRHVPAAYYTDLASCGQYALPMGSATTETGQFYGDVSSGDLPNFSFITPNMIDDAHGSNVATGDAWLSEIIPYITNGPNYQSGNTVIFITNDEGTGSDSANDENCASQTLSSSQPSCHVPTTVVAPYVPTGLKDATFYTHYSMLRTTEELLGLPLLGLAASANSMTANFNLGPISEDFSPPTAPSGLTATTVSSSQVTLSWSPSMPGTAALAGYEIVRNGTVIATTSGAATSFNDSSAIAATGYSYSVAALDATGNISAASNTAVATTPSTSNLLQDPDFTNWSNNAPVGWSKYGSYTTLTSSSNGEGGTPATVVTATDSGYTSAGVSDGSPPTISGSTVSGTTYAASCWVEATDTVNVTVQLRETGQTPVATTVTLPTFNTWYQVQVTDTAVKSGDSMPMSVYSTNMVSDGRQLSVSNCSLAVDTYPTSDPSPPTQPQNLTAVAGDPNQISLSWSSSTGANGVAGYNVLRNGTQVASTAGTSYTDNAVAGSTTYSYQVEAFDYEGDVSPPSTAASVTTPPNVPPQAPTNLAATAASSDEVNLSWAAATPGSSPVASYQVFRNGSQVASVTGTSYSDAGVTASTSYTYSVVAVDSNGLSSGDSTAASVTTPADAPPQPPTNLSANAVSSGEVNLSWTAAAPGSAPVVSYQIFRNGSQISSVTGTTYSDTAVTASTAYTYYVLAVDGNGLLSSNSNLVSVTTPAGIANLLVNPNFASWNNGVLVGWYTYGPATKLSQSTNSYGGNSYAVQVATTASSYTAAGINAGNSSSSPVISSTVAGATYTGSCWVEASKIITITVELHEVSSRGASVKSAATTSYKVPSAGNWYDLSVSDTAVGEGNLLPFSIFSTNTVAGGATFEVGSCSLSSSQAAAFPHGIAPLPAVERGMQGQDSRGVPPGLLVAASLYGEGAPGGRTAGAGCTSSCSVGPAPAGNVPKVVRIGASHHRTFRAVRRRRLSGCVGPPLTVWSRWNRKSCTRRTSSPSVLGSSRPNLLALGSHLRRRTWGVPVARR